jgi:hypothetical protein
MIRVGALWRKGVFAAFETVVMLSLHRPGPSGQQHSHTGLLDVSYVRRGWAVVLRRVLS